MPRYSLRVNGKSESVTVDADTPLLYVLRDDLALKGPKFGCGLGQCGACTVHVDGVATRSCLLPVSTLAGKNITTLEGLSQNGQPGKLQQAFIDEQAAQCGYCINGIIMTVTGLLGRTPPADRREIVETLDERHLCRCGAQGRILRAIDRAIAGMPGAAS